MKNTKLPEALRGRTFTPKLTRIYTSTKLPNTASTQDTKSEERFMRNIEYSRKIKLPDALQRYTFTPKPTRIYNFSQVA